MSREKANGIRRRTVGVVFPEQGRRDRRGPEFRPLGEYPRALRLASELADLRAADADRIPLRAERGRSRGR